jgi:ATP-dependent Clp protease ATP-binding subunit ClpC
VKDIVDKFSTQLKNVLTRALCFVVETNRRIVHPEHLLWALGTQKGCLAAEILTKANVKPEQLRALIMALESTVEPELPPATELSLHLSEEAKRVLEKAVLTANVYGHRYVGTEHLLSGMLQVSDGDIDAFFSRERVNVQNVREQLALVLKSTSKFPDLAETITRAERELPIPSRDETLAMPTPEESSPDAPKKTPALDYFGRELTTAEAQERIDPVIGRENETLRVMEILCRRTKNNPLLIGEPGVGKTAIVEGLAKQIMEGSVPPPLRDKRIFALDMALLIAGTMYRGEFEARLRQVVDEVREHDEIVLFIDELHTIVGAGAASGSLDAANILKPALARGEIRCIGATTAAEYKKHIENDAALERRFQSVFVDEPSAEKTMDILRGVSSGYEEFHSVRISPSAIEAAVRLSCRYIQDKHLPDKALDLLDEAAAASRVHAPEPGPAEQRRMLQRRLNDLQELKRQAVVEERFLDAITLKDEEEQLRETLRKTREKPVHDPVRVITENDIAGVVARRTGIPLHDLIEEERRRLTHLEDALRTRVLGQDDVVQKVASAMRRAKTGIGEQNRPLASFLFLGPSGVGKTELAKAVADLVFHDRKALVRLDMSEYAEGFTVSKLIGAPAGYVGYRDAAKLTDAVKQRPYSVVLFDELEKAHRDVQNLLLQVLEEGELTDATGRKISFRHAVIVLTSNVGLERFERGGIGFMGGDADRKITLDGDVRRELEERFRPELLNRVDHTCLFQPLASETMTAIAHKQLRELETRLRERGVEIAFGDDVAAHVASLANPKFGARDIRRVIETHIEHGVADRLLKAPTGKRLQASVRAQKISLSVPR